jgi:hypothetical protein
MYTGLNGSGAVHVMRHTILLCITFGYLRRFFLADARAGLAQGESVIKS